MILSFEIGTDSIALMSVDNGMVTPVTTITLSRGSIQEGVMSDAESVFRQISNELTDRGIKARQCEFVFPASVAITRGITLPNTPDSKLLPLLSTQIEQSLPDIKNYVLDYIEFSPEDDGKRTLLAVLMPIRIVEQYLALAARLGLKCILMDLRFARLRRIVGSYVDDPAFIVIDLLPGEAEVSLFEGDKVFVRSRELTEQDSSLADWGITFASSGPGSAEQADMLASIVESLIQFQAGRNRDLPVDGIYVMGETERYREMLGMCANILNRGIVPLMYSAPADAGESAGVEG